MRKLYLLAFLVANLGMAQEKIELIESEKILEKASEELQANNYEKSLELLKKINKNDSIYYEAWESKSYLLSKLKKNEELIDEANKALASSGNFSKETFYVNKGVALMNLEKYEEAIANYNEALERNPKSYLLWFNKGVALESLGKINKAIEAYQKSITFNSMFKNPHVKLGDIFYKQKRITQALMAYNMYLLLSPDSPESFTVLKTLNTLVAVKNEHKINEDLIIDEADDNYEEIDLILDSHVAIHKDYEVGNDINLALTMQNHAMLSQLAEFEGNDGFWSTKYLELYKWIFENDLFNNFTYTIAYSSQNERHKKIIAKKEKQIIDFLGKFYEKWEEIIGSNTITLKGKKQDVLYSYGDDGEVEAIGTMKDNLQVGYWEYYNESGLVTANGEYDDKGERIGKWTWYTDYNIIKETADYKNGKLNGVNDIFYKSQKPYVKANYLDSKLSGEYVYYNETGALAQRKYFEEDELNGLYQSFFPLGEKYIEFHIPYKKGKIEGEMIEYYANGSVYYKANFKDGKIEGEENKYFINKQQSTKISYTNGELNGPYVTFYDNGQINEEGQSVDGFYDGPWKLYHSNGNLKSEFTYKAGKLVGNYQTYDVDGKLYNEFEYRNGKVIAYKYFNKEGKIIKEGKKRGGEFYYEAYSPQGTKTSEGLYDVSGGKTGEWRYYSKNGILTSKGNFKEDNTIGDYYEYYSNGKPKTITPYKNDVVDGYYTQYYVNGNLSAQGWYKNGVEIGEWHYYYMDGTLSSVNFYHKGKLHGEQIYYAVNGKLSHKTQMKYGKEVKTYFFNEAGKQVNVFNFHSNKPEQTLIEKFKNGGIKRKTKFLYGIKNGAYETFYYNGNKKIVGTYLNDKKHGSWTWYYESGKIEATATYNNGTVDGEILNYYENGVLDSKSITKNGLTSDTYISNYENGVKHIEGTYYRDELHGERKFYSPTGKLQFIRYYNYGRLIGYSYQNKEGKLVEMIPIENETGKIEAYYDNGQVSRRMEYFDGDLINDLKTYYYNGKLQREAKMVENEYQGVRKDYYLNGNLKLEYTYNHGKLHGLAKEYFKNGKLKSSIEYRNDSKNGNGKFYNKQGKLIKEKIYFDDDTVEVKTY